MNRKYDIAPKKTQYGNVNFKSRLEARWAVFFDSLGIQWEYEPFYSEVETGCKTFYYKPDFFLPRLNRYIEVKPTKPTENENAKAAAWSKDFDEIVILFNLNPPSFELENGWHFFFPEIKKVPILTPDFWWGECPKCGHIDIDVCAEITSCGCYDIHYYNKFCEQTKVGHSREKTNRLLKAYSIAKNHSFDKYNPKRVTKIPVQIPLLNFLQE